MIPTQIPVSESLNNLAHVIMAHLNATAGELTLTIERRHMAIVADAIISAAERVDMLEQSDRSLDAVSRELLIARANIQRLELELDAERYRRSIAEVAYIKEAGEDAENVIDLSEHFRREKGLRS